MGWLKWGIPLGLVVLLAAAFGGAVLAQREYGAAAASAERSGDEPVEDRISRSGVAYSPDAAAYPDQRIIEGLLDNYFDSINHKNYELWRSTVPPSKWKELPKGQWHEAYDSTRDYDIRVDRIDPAKDRSALVMMSFKSEQDLEDAPPEVKSRCVQWNVVYPVVLSGNGSAQLDISKLPNSSIAAPC
ncbi:hypothetical protein [Saccharopolyspora halophila]|uniref:hypothetical protein n=1 Tax=Saccharopolyspora halophila TaxID=405551 RepID=UPI0031D7B660